MTLWLNFRARVAHCPEFTLAVFCEKTECILENVVCGAKLGNLTLELADADGLLLWGVMRLAKKEALTDQYRKCLSMGFQITGWRL